MSYKRFAIIYWSDTWLISFKSFNHILFKQTWFRFFKHSYLRVNWILIGGILNWFFTLRRFNLVNLNECINRCAVKCCFFLWLVRSITYFQCSLTHIGLRSIIWTWLNFCIVHGRHTWIYYVSKFLFVLFIRHHSPFRKSWSWKHCWLWHLVFYLVEFIFIGRGRNSNQFIPSYFFWVFLK